MSSGCFVNAAFLFFLSFWFIFFHTRKLHPNPGTHVNIISAKFEWVNNKQQTIPYKEPKEVKYTFKHTRGKQWAPVSTEIVGSLNTSHGTQGEYLGLRCLACHLSVLAIEPATIRSRAQISNHQDTTVCIYNNSYLNLIKYCIIFITIIWMPNELVYKTLYFSI